MRDVNEPLHHVCISLPNSLLRVVFAGNGKITILTVAESEMSFRSILQSTRRQIK